MPSLSGWALQPEKHSPRPSRSFLCPRCRAGLCNWPERRPTARANVSMPSVSGWALQLAQGASAEGQIRSFLCPRCRAGLCNYLAVCVDRITDGFYALGVGLGFAMGNAMAAYRPAQFLCPRCRAGLCNASSARRGMHLGVLFLCPRCRAGLCDHSNGGALAAIVGFYALGVGLGFATFGGRRERERDSRTVSMPSVSGWALQ